MGQIFVADSQGSRSCSRTWSALQKATTYVPYVERAVPLRHAHFKLNRAFTVTKLRSFLLVSEKSRMECHRKVH